MEASCSPSSLILGGGKVGERCEGVGVQGEKEVATVAAGGAESRDALRKPFLQISCDSCQTYVLHGWPVEESGKSFYVQNREQESRFYQSSCCLAQFNDT